MSHVVKINVLKKISGLEGNPSIGKIAKRINTSRQTLLNWEEGKSLKSFQILKDLAEELNCTVDELIITKKSKK